MSDISLLLDETVSHLEDASRGIRLCGRWQGGGSRRQIVQTFRGDLRLDTVDELRDGPGEMQKRPLSLREFSYNTG